MKARLRLVFDPTSLDLHRADLIIVVLLLVFTSLIAYTSSQLVDPVILQDYTEDVWFGSDIERVFSNMSSRTVPNFRAKVHPLFSLLAFPLVKVIRAIGRVTPATAVMLLVAGTTAIWVGLLFVTLRLMGCRRFDATVFSVLAWSSAALIFWTTVPETYLFGSLSMLVALFLVVLSQTTVLPIWSYILMSAFTLSITTTNWMVGIAATVMSHTWKRTIAITGMALAIVVVLWSVQSRIFSGTTFITDLSEETNYILPKTSGGPIRVLLGFIFHPMIVPALQVIPSNRNQIEWPLLSVQQSFPGSGGIWGMVAVLLWTALLIFGVLACWKVRKNRKLSLVIGFGLLGQLALHLVYGDETFLYAIHLIPFLILMSAMATLTRWRMMVLGLAIPLIVFAGLNNGNQFFLATEFLKHRGGLREQIPILRSNMPTIQVPLGAIVLGSPLHSTNPLS